jgi:ribosome-binding factor A
MNHGGGRRPDRVAELMQRKLAQLIQHDVHDPRIPKWITILAVDISKDLGHARVYFTAIDDKPEEVAEVLNQSASFLRTALAKTMTVRRVPKLSFIYDASVEYGKNLSRLIDEVNDADTDAETNSDID